MSHSDEYRLRVWQFMESARKDHPDISDVELFGIAKNHVDALLADTEKRRAERAGFLDAELEDYREAYGEINPAEVHERARREVEQLPGYASMSKGQREAAVKALKDVWTRLSVTEWSATSRDVDQHGVVFMARVVRVVDGAKPVGIFRVKQVSHGEDLNLVVEHLEPGKVTAGDAPAVKIYEPAERLRAGLVRLQVRRSKEGGFVFPGGSRVSPKKLADKLWTWSTHMGDDDMPLSALQWTL